MQVASARMALENLSLISSSRWRWQHPMLWVDPNRDVIGALFGTGRWVILGGAGRCAVRRGETVANWLSIALNRASRDL
jgi:hypothetical protein